MENSVAASSKNTGDFADKGIFLLSYLTERSSDNDVSLSQDHNYVQELRGHNRRSHRLAKLKINKLNNSNNAGVILRMYETVSN